MQFPVTLLPIHLCIQWVILAIVPLNFFCCYRTPNLLISKERKTMTQLEISLITNWKYWAEKSVGVMHSLTWRENKDKRKESNAWHKFILTVSAWDVWVSILIVNQWETKSLLFQTKDILISFCDTPHVVVTLVATSHYFSQGMLITFSFFLRGTNYMCVFSIVYIISSWSLKTFYYKILVAKED